MEETAKDHDDEFDSHIKKISQLEKSEVDLRESI